MAADFQSIVYQIVLSVLRSGEFTSASPGHINTFIGVTGGPGEIGTSEELREAILSIIGEDFEGDNPDSIVQDLLDAEGKKKKKGKLEAQGAGLVKTGLGAATNPAGAAMSLVQFMPHAALVLLAVSLTPFIFDVLTKPGGPMDLRFKRIIDEEINAFLSRQTQKDTEMGVRQVIVQSKLGFTASNGLNNYNTMKGIREGGINKERLDRLGMIDHSKGSFETG